MSSRCTSIPVGKIKILYFYQIQFCLGENWQLNLVINYWTVQEGSKSILKWNIWVGQKFKKKLLTSFLEGPQSKCFTYVTKTIANLTTYYSRKWGDYNDTIIFEIDIMKNSSLLIHIFCHCQNQNNTFFLLASQHSQLSFRVNQNKRNNQKICEKVKLIDKDWNWFGRTFSWYQSQK